MLCMINQDKVMQHANKSTYMSLRTATSCHCSGPTRTYIHLEENIHIKVNGVYVSLQATFRQSSHKLSCIVEQVKCAQFVTQVHVYWYSTK